MYALMGIDAVLRITAALLALFVGVPALARKKPEALDRRQWFWWCLAAGITLLTLVGQLLTLIKAFSTMTLLLAIAVLVIAVRARVTGRPPATIVRDVYRNVILFSLNILEGRVNVRRRMRRALRHLRARAHWSWAVAAWCALIAVAAVMRLYRPFSTANLGFSDTYVHLYLIRLLEQGRQVDPAWGPYPRGMHFLLYAIHELTNVDAILLMNFFGAVAGVLMTLAVADTARRLSRSLVGGLVAGLIFATMVGGGSQYFLLGGSIATENVSEAREFGAMDYGDIPPTEGEFDVLLTVFQRQTATLPQELAIVLLFPAAMFLLTWQSWWSRSGYLFCASAIAATHPGVAVPLVLLSAVCVVVRRFDVTLLKQAMLTGAAGIAIGSTWMIAYLAYPRIAAAGRDVASANGAGSAAAYYFPFLRQGEVARIVTWTAVTPFLIACLVIAVALLFRKQWFISLVVLLFFVTHIASRFSLPEVVEVRRNASWLAMSLAILLGGGAAELMRVRAAKYVAAAMLVLWLWRVPLVSMHDKLVNYSGYGATAYAVLEIERKLEPFTWTLITYGQEFPMVLGRGFHLPAADFLDRYDPSSKLTIPTPFVFIAVEKTPHRFQINAWMNQFSRADVEQRLQTWCFLYQLSHKDMGVFLDDEHVRVYMIRHSVVQEARSR